MIALFVATATPAIGFHFGVLSFVRHIYFQLLSQVGVIPITSRNVLMPRNLCTFAAVFESRTMLRECQNARKSDEKCQG